jgi:hypothetical protein
MTYFERSAAVGGALADFDALFSYLRTLCLAEGMTEIVLNASSANPSANGLLGRESLFQINGTEDQPTRAYIGLTRARAATTGQVRFSVWGCERIKGPIEIATLSRPSGSNIVTVTTVAPHGLSNGDRIAINGSSNDVFHDGWIRNLGAPACTITVTGANTFTFVSVTIPGALQTATGGVAIATYVEAGIRQSGDGTSAPNCVVADATIDELWGFVTPYSLMFVARQSAVYSLFHVGCVERSHIPPQLRGTGFTTGALSAGSSVSVPLDRDGAANLRAGQSVWIMSADSATCEIATIASVTNDSTIVIGTLANSYGAGALVGLDPCPLVVAGRIGSVTTTTNFADANHGWYSSRNRDATFSNPGAQVNTMAVNVVPINESNVDPDSYSIWTGVDLFCTRTSAGEGMRGRVFGVQFMGTGAQSQGDTFLAGGDAPDFGWRAFVTMGGNGTYLWCIGPGATAAGTSRFMVRSGLQELAEIEPGGLPTFTITRVSSEIIRLDFDEPVLKIPTLEWTGAYWVTPEEPNADDLPELEVLGVRLGTVTPGDVWDTVTQVFLDTSEQGPSDYDVIVFGLERVE